MMFSLRYKRNNVCVNLLSVILFSFLSTSSFAKTHFLEDSSELDQLRSHYQQATIAFSSSNSNDYNHHKSKLATYPLYPYLIYNELTANSKAAPIDKINNFINEYNNTPLSAILRTKTLTKLAKHKNWKDFLLLYKSTQSNYLECQYAKALYKEGFIEPAFNKAKQLWHSGRSQHKACDYIFQALQDEGIINNDLIWQRIKLALKRNNIKLIKYLSKQLDNTDKSWVKLTLQSHYKPEKLLNNKLVLQQHQIQLPIIEHAISRLIKKSPEDAFKLYQIISSQVVLPLQSKNNIMRSIGLTLSYKHNPEANDWLKLISEENTDKTIARWRIQNAIRHQHWQDVISYIEKLPPTKQQKIRWQFWWAFANKELGNEIDAYEILSKVALKRDYYGFLSADILGLPYQFENKPIVLNEIVTKKINNLLGIKRARELHHFNELSDARREWNYSIHEFNDEELLNAAKIAHSWGWHDRAIAAIGKTNNLNDIEIRFPLAYQDSINKYSDKSEIDNTWTYAIIRRESIFIEDAKSSAGAVGLMQLMPRTARATARLTRTKYKGRSQLVNVNSNIHLGTQYLKSLYSKYYQQSVLATAAYNAGPGNVKRWLPENKPMDAIRWIESIPYTETREYVTNVLAYQIIYQHRLGYENTKPLSHILMPVPSEI